MATKTEVLELLKPLLTEYYDVNVYNENLDLVDKFAKDTNAKLGNKADKSDTVTLDTNQAIAGTKTFKESVVMEKTAWIKQGLTTDNVYTNWLQRDHYVESALGGVVTDVNTNNERWDIIFGNNNLNGWIELDIASSYNYGNAIGRLCVRIAIVTTLSAGGTINTQFKIATESDPWINGRISISDVLYDETKGYYITVGNIASGDGNTYYHVLRAHGSSVPKIENVRMSDKYVATTPTLTKLVPQLHSNSCLWDGSMNMPIVGIVEQGSNANGSYVKFNNGLMICWFSKSTYGETQWSFPIGFVSSPIVNITPAYTLPESISPMITALQGGYMRFRLSRSTSFIDNVGCLLHAIGYWK